MATTSWLTCDEVIGLAFEARSRGEFRQEIIRSIMNAAGCEMGLFSDEEAPVAKSDLVNIPVRVAERSRLEMRGIAPQLEKLFQYLRKHGAVVDRLLYSSREMDTMPFVVTQRQLGVTSSILMALPPARGSARFICISATGPVLSSVQAERAARLLKSIAVGDGSLASAEHSSGLEKLSCRQRQLANLVSQGWSNAEIARMAGISPNTVRNHLAAIFEHLQVSNRTELALLIAGADCRQR